MLETLNGPTNINNLNLPELPSEPLTFDLERDITEGDWEAMKKTLSVDKAEINISRTFRSYVEMASRMKILFPEKYPELDIPVDLLGISSIQHAEIEKQLNAGASPFVGDSGALTMTLLWDLRNIAILAPEKRTEMRKIYQELEKKVVDGLAKAFVSSYLYLPDLAIIFPERILPIIRSNEEMIISFAPEKVGDPNVTVDMVATESAEYRLLFPEEPIDFNSQDWAEMRRLLKENKNQGNWFKVASLAFNMKVLAAEKAWINDSGDIEIIMPEPKTPLIEPTPALPEVRKF